MDKISLTTSLLVAGRPVVEEFGIVSAECVFGMNIFRDFLAGLTDVFGGRSTETQDVMKAAKQTALNELRREIDGLGANAVIGLRMDFKELGGGSKNGMILFYVYGTAVKIADKKQ